MRFLLSDLARACGGALEGQDMEVCGASIDSRECGAGSIFFALRGTRTDGHGFAGRVIASGGAAVVSQGDWPGGPVIRVPSVPDALLACGAHARGRLEGTVGAVTGSAGKTTTKELLVLALGTRMRTDCSRGNLNNSLGLPLSLMNVDEGAEAVVLELGMNHEGELAGLGAVARPRWCVVTNIGSAHLEYFGDRGAVARAKAELLDTTERGGFCVIPSGEEILRERAEARGLEIIETGPGGDMSLRSDGGGWVVDPLGTRLDLSLEGAHHYANALTALAAAVRLGADPDEAAGAMGSYRGAPGRGLVFRWRGASVMDEGYNASPEAVEACLAVLADSPPPRGVVLADMLELGSASRALHLRVLARASDCGLDFAVLVGGRMREASGALGGTRTVFADDWSEALDALRRLASPGMTILVKGSHSMALEKLTAALREEDWCSTGSCTL